MPRGFIKRLVVCVIGKHEKAIEATLTSAATSRKSVIAFFDFAAKLNKEIGASAAAATAPTRSSSTRT